MQTQSTTLLSETEQEGTMPQVYYFWHSILQRVCHNNTSCTTGNNIEQRYFSYGTGGRPLCKECERLNQQRR